MGLAASCFYKPTKQSLGLNTSLRDSQDSFIDVPVHSIMGNTIQAPKKNQEWFSSFFQHFTKRRSHPETAKSFTLSIDTALVEIDMLDASFTDCVSETPKGAQALKYRHFCPICYRHFSQIYMTECCKQNICYPCAVSHAHAKLSKMRKEADNFEGEIYTKGLSCPTCNSSGCVLVRISNNLNSRSYVDSPSTIQLMKRSQTNQNKIFFSQISQQQQFQLTRQYSDPTSYSLFSISGVSSTASPSQSLSQSPSTAYAGKAFSLTLTRNQSTPSQLSLIS